MMAQRALNLNVRLSVAVFGLIPGLVYLALFLCGILQVIDFVGLLSDRIPAWFTSAVIGGLVVSAVVGLSGGATRLEQSRLRACTLLAVLLLVLDVPLMLVQLVSLFVYLD